MQRFVLSSVRAGGIRAQVILNWKARIYGVNAYISRIFVTNFASMGIPNVSKATRE